MKFSLLTIAVMAHLASATFGGGRPGQNYCGTTTITEVCKTATKTSYSHFPTVTSTVTKKKNFCETQTTKTVTDVHTVVQKTKIVTTPTITKVVNAPQTTKTVTKTATVTACPTQGKPKRHFLEERTEALELELERDIETEYEYIEEITEEVEEDAYAGLSNAERIRRGLPLAKPVVKRTWCRDGKCDHKPPAAGPSCVPKTVKVEVTKTVTKNKTPTAWVTTTKCGHTKTAETVVRVTSTTTKMKTETKEGKPTTVTSTNTPCKTHYAQATITVPPKGGCRT